MIKHVNGRGILRKMQGNCKVYVKHFCEEKTKCMKDYIKPSQCENSDHYILHVDTNDLCLDWSPELIAKCIINLALTSHDVSVSNIVIRNDSDTLNKKECEVNAVLMELRKEKNIYLINNSKKIKPQHLNKGKWNHGGSMLYVTEDIPSNLLKVELLPIESFYVEPKLQSKNRLKNCSYNPNRNAIGNHLEALSDFLDFQSLSYSNIIILGDFNVGVEEPHVKTF